jgi:hypothetical protein
MLIKKFSLTCLLISLFIPFIYSQGTAINVDTTVLREQAMEMSSSFVNGDHKNFIKFTYPKVVKMMGGENKMVNFLEKGIDQMKKEGVAFKSVTVGLTDQKVRAGKEIHTLVSQRIVMAVPGGTVTANSYLLAISQNDGHTWLFVDTAPFNDLTRLKAVLPHYNPDLKIPEKQQPVFAETK